VTSDRRNTGENLSDRPNRLLRFDILVIDSKMVVARTRSRLNGSHKPATKVTPVLLVGAMFGLICFYGGFLLGSTTSPATVVSRGLSDAEVYQRVQEEVTKETKRLQVAEATAAADDVKARFPDEMKKYAVGLGRVDRDEFASTFDMGVPLDPSESKNSEVMLLYSTVGALPSDSAAASEAASMTTMPLLKAKEATANCDFVNVVLTDFSAKRRQCVAIMGQYEAFHIQKFMRLPEEDGAKLDPEVSLRLVNRGSQASGRMSTKPPTLEETRAYWSILTQYLESLDSVLEQLRPIAEKVAVNNSIVVLVCNFGQSELLLNFVCAANSRGIDLSAVLVFATDEETRDLAESHGLAAFYDKTNFGDMPKEAAGRYADKTFAKMMLAKVYCVQMISMLGYDLLFQDVDIVWHRNPLEYFHDENSPHQNYDMYFQDDGNHALFYAPYSANTGFYYIRNNAKTQHFFNTFLMSGDLIYSTRSHQVPLVALLTEHASMYGIKVKIFARTENDFPGGHAYHRRKDFMKDMIAGKEKPYIFHMSWTHNKSNKMKYFQQLGEWRVQESCVAKTPTEIKPDFVSGDSLISTCCAAEPIIQCHYRDKPSKIPCKDSPPIDKGHRSFW